MITSNGYTIRETLDNGRAYDCTMCPHSSPDLDLARAHYAVHVAGPELLKAIKVINNSHGEFGFDLAEDAITKAEPKGT